MQRAENRVVQKLEPKKIKFTIIIIILFHNTGTFYLLSNLAIYPNLCMDHFKCKDAKLKYMNTWGGIDATPKG